MKKIVSLLTVLVMTCTVLTSVIPVGAEESQTATDSAIENEITVEGINSFGNLLSEKLDTESAEQEANNGCNVYTAEVTGNEVAVTFETTQYCTLLAAVYTEDGVQMLASGTAEVTPEETEKTVTIETEEMPEYFYLKVFLVDTSTLRPICTTYESPNYTQEMQEFFAKTVDDFDAERVLNLDEDPANNFAVFSEDTILIQSDESTNTVASADEESESYVIENADETVTSLQNGDIFSLEAEDGNLLIVKVDEVTVDGTTATIAGQDTDMEEVFEYVKIDTSQNSDEAEIDTSNLEEGVTYNGLVEDIEDVGDTEETVETENAEELDETEIIEDYSEMTAYNSPVSILSSRPRAFVDEEFEKSLSASFKLADKKLMGDNKKSINVNGTINFKIATSLKVYVSWSYSYCEAGFNLSAGLNLSIEAKAKGAIKLGEHGFSPLFGLYIEVEPSIVVEVSAEIALTGTVKTSLTCTANTDTGAKIQFKKPEFNTKVAIEGTVFIGFSLEPRIGIVSDKISKIALTAKAGIELSGELELYNNDKSDSEYHECKYCVDGEIFKKGDVSFNISFLNLEKLTFTCKLPGYKDKIGDFYYSLDYDEFAFTSCPHMKYKTTVTVKDANGDEVENADVSIETATQCIDNITDEKGQANVFLPNGTYTITAVKNNSRGSKKITIKNNPRSIVVKLATTISDTENDNNTNPDNPDDNNNENTQNALKVKSLSLGDYNSAAITEDGSLYTWGENSDGQLGNGTIEESFIPIKIMDNVKSVSFGRFHSAAITEDGSLYMWGLNYYGELGNGTTEESFSPIKIMDNVKSVSLGEAYSAAITEDGSLYTWGCNADGELGNGTTEESLVPIKIMNNVKSVSIDCCNSAAITEDGSLYVWGSNKYGELGNGTEEDSSEPLKIMDNVKFVSLGYSHSAAITEDGSLYMWGYGCLGNGEKGSSEIPIKIMDNVKSVSLGHSHSAAITEDGSLYTWGENFSGQLGDGTTEDSLVPIKIMNNVKSVSLARYHSGAITEDGSVYMWGTNSSGELGIGEAFDYSSNPIKIEIPSESTAETDTSTASYSALTIAADETDGTKQFADLLPNEVYNFYAFKSSEAESILSSENLLYVNQAVSDESGNFTVSYIPKEEYADAVFIVKAMSQTDISSAEVTLSDMPYNGEEQFAEPVVTLDGVTLEQGEHYDIEGDYSATNSGTYEITIVGTGNYTGKITASYSITCEHVYEDGICIECGDEEEVTALAGDANQDDAVNVRDAAFIAQKLAQGKSDELPANADFNNDNNVNVRDAAAIASWLASKDKENQ